ncbi:MAG: hypothetical protein ACYSTQ_05745, partial [Planctomycetota bacterium]
VLIGIAFGRLEPREVASWILEDGVDVRLQLQLHRYVWPPDTLEGMRLRSAYGYEIGSGSGTPKRRDG